MSSLIAPRWWICALVGAGLVYLRAADAPELSRAEAELAKRFAGVAQWQGIYEVSEIGAATISRANGYHLESRYEGKGHGTFTLDRATDDSWDPAAGIFTWNGKGEARGGGAGTFSEWGQRGIGEEWSQEFSGAARQERIELSLWLSKKTALLHAGVQRGEPLMRRTGRMVSAQSSGGTEVSPIDTTFPAPLDVWYLGSSEGDAARRWQVMSQGPGVLAFTYEGPAAGRSQKFLVSGGGVIQRNKVVLFPVYEDLEVEVTIADYAKWRPLGSIADPKKPGNTLVARATLKSKGGAAKAPPPIKEFRFELMDTSREPGVCLNWPLEAKDDDFDLRLAVASTGGDLSDRDQKLAISTPPVNSDGRPYAEATVESFDFGGRAELRVICELADGREIIGLMKEAGGEQDLVRLPKMNGPDWIAESWRREKDVMKLAAGDDAEKVDGQKDDGDGYTLYEEYRGWSVNGKHVEGDPKRKDFFVLNLIGADAKAGINLFEALSKLRVHSTLRRSEMSRGKRLMNGNHRDAPWRVNQHGVWVTQFLDDAPGTKDARTGKQKLGDTGAITPLTRAGVAGRPGIVVGIGLLARNNTENLFNQPFNLPARDMIFAYDRAIAHELMHSVGVEHHGSGDGMLSAWWVSPRHPRNQVGRPYFRGMTRISMSDVRARDDVITLLNEQGHDLATQYMTKYADDRIKVDNWYKERLVAEGKAYMAGHAGQQGLAWNSAEAYTEYFLEEHVSGGFAFLAANVGELQGQHSGNQECLMRYYFAKFYPVRGKEDTYYLVTPGTERIGIDICHSRQGTGINAPKPSNLPQSRYGDAAGDAGNCFEQICPNDAIPPRATKS